MKVILRADVDDVGKKGDIVDVAAGFARNYLVPKGLALRATDGTVAQAAAMRRPDRRATIIERAFDDEPNGAACGQVASTSTANQQRCASSFPQAVRGKVSSGWWTCEQTSTSGRGRSQQHRKEWVGRLHGC